MVWDVVMEVVESIFDSISAEQGVGLLLAASSAAGGLWWFMR